MVIYIEEIEVLFKHSSPENIENFFEVFTDKKKNLILVGITNTINFEFNLEEKLQKSLPGMKSIMFVPYNVEQMEEIMKTKVHRIQ